MIDKLPIHYSLQNNPTVYDEEALTSLELVARTTGKVNEVIDQSNKLNDDTRAWMVTTTAETIPNEVENHIKNGDFDNQIEKSLNNLNERVNNLLGSVSVGSTTMDAEVIDGRTGVDGLGYSNLGEAIRSQVRMLSESVNSLNANHKIVFDNLVEGEAYSTLNGIVSANSADWKRSAHVTPCPEGVFFVSDQHIQDDAMMVICFDKHFAFLGHVYISNNNYPAYSYGVTPNGTAYVGLNVQSFNGNTSFTLQPLCMDGVNYLEVISGKEKVQNCLYYENKCVLASGLPLDGEFDMAVFPVGDDVNYIFHNGNMNYNCHCYDGNNQLLKTGDSEDDYLTIGGGRLYPIPSGTKYVNVNFSHKSYNHEETNLSQYITLVRNKTDRLPLSGKRVLCIGDSITWLDGKSGTDYDNSIQFVGYQKQIRKRGAIVDSMGYSGGCYALRTNSDGTEITSIYTRVVTDNLDVSGFDVVVLMGGTNDVLYSLPIGDVGTYENPNIDPWTMHGAIGGIVSYIRKNNPSAEIYMCTMIPSSSSNRTLEKMLPYRDALINASVFWSLPLIDTFTRVNLSPVLAKEDYYYDSTHPNYKGMEKIGAVIARGIESNTRI